MKIRKISFKDHPILGSVSFDFTDAAGRTVDTIIVAGENGCGKSFLLSFINSYNPLLSAQELGFTLTVEVELSVYDIQRLYENKHFVNVIGNHFVGPYVKFIHDTSFPDAHPRVQYKSREGIFELTYALNFFTDPSIYKTVFSDVEINFTPSPIRHTTSSNLDSVFKGSLRSRQDLATEIKQLLIDINELDNDELARWVDDHKGHAPGEEVKHRRIRRFTNAFDQMFPHKHFVGIDNRDNTKVVLFEEFGNTMEISQLSSGEKQIVFRGGFLLRNLGTINGAIILVDEPELSLHPQWQLKILNFLKGLFTDETGEQTSQLIVATHSPFILHNDTRSNDKVIVMQKNDKGELKILDKPEYYSWSKSTAVEEAFHIAPMHAANKVIVYLEGDTDERYFNKALAVYGFDSSLVSFQWIGHYVGADKGKATNTGDKALNSAASFFKANPRMMQDSKVYLLYDCDTNKPYEQQGQLFVASMTKNPYAKKYQIGVENLLVLPDDFDYEKFTKTRIETNQYGAVSTIADLDKPKLTDYITSLSSEHLQTILQNVKKEIENVLKNTGVLKTD